MSELDFEQQLKVKLWEGEYYHKGFPIVRLLADLAFSRVLDTVADRIHIDTNFTEET